MTTPLRLEPGNIDELRFRYVEALRNDALVSAIPVLIAHGITELDALKAIAACLVENRNALVARVMELEMIVPTRIKKPDGTVLRWDAPDHLVPLKEIKA